MSIENIDQKIVLFQRGSFEAGVILDPTDEIMSMLNNMTVGSSGAQYLHKNIGERMTQLPNKYFLYIAQSGHVKGSFTAAQRTIQADFGLANAYYVRYLVFHEKMQATKEKPVKHGRSDGMFKKMTKRYLSDSPAKYGIGYNEDASLPSFFYAFFDAENFRSTDMSQIMGLQPVGDFDTFTFTRLHPRAYANVEQLDQVHYPAMKERLAQQYQNFSAYTDIFLFLNNNYFVWKENGEVVAGVQVNKCQWEVKNMSGISGFFMLRVLPYLPGIRHYFNPKKFEFITFDYIYVKPGYENKLQLLFTTMLQKFDVNFSLLWQDVKSPLHHTLHELDLGFLSNFSKVPTGKIMMTTNNLSEKQLQQITQKPMFTCGLDMT